MAVFLLQVIRHAFKVVSGGGYPPWKNISNYMYSNNSHNGNIKMICEIVMKT